jgi:hypothetical protein
MIFAFLPTRMMQQSPRSVVVYFILVPVAIFDVVEKVGRVDMLENGACQGIREVQ